MREGLRNELRWKKQAEAGDQPGWADEPALGPQPSPSAGCRPRVGVAGCGYWGSKHVRVLCSSPDVAGVVVVDPDPRTREAILSAFPGVSAFPDLAAALPHIDALIVATPPRTHG